MSTTEKGTALVCCEPDCTRTAEYEVMSSHDSATLTCAEHLPWSVDWANTVKGTATSAEVVWPCQTD